MVDEHRYGASGGRTIHPLPEAGEGGCEAGEIGQINVPVIIVVERRSTYFGRRFCGGTALLQAVPEPKIIHQVDVTVAVGVAERTPVLMYGCSRLREGAHVQLIGHAIIVCISKVDVFLSGFNYWLLLQEDSVGGHLDRGLPGF